MSRVQTENNMALVFWDFSEQRKTGGGSDHSLLKSLKISLVFRLWRSVVSRPVFWSWARLRLIEYLDNFQELIQSRIIQSIPEIAVYFFEQVQRERLTIKYLFE